MSLHLLNRQTELLADILQRSILLSLPARVPQLDWAASISHVLRTEVSTMISLPLPKGACLQAVIILKISGSDRGIQIGRDHPSSGLGCHLPSRIAHRSWHWSRRHPEMCESHPSVSLILEDWFLFRVRRHVWYVRNGAIDERLIAGASQGHVWLM